MKKGKKSRMTPDRLKALEDLGFKWSAPSTGRPRKSKDGTVEDNAADITANEENEKDEGNTDAAAVTEDAVTDPTPAEALVKAEGQSVEV
jgi:hypothetical protein